MFGIGLWETVIIILVIIMFIKPKDIPTFIRKIGRLIGQLKYSYDIFTKNIRELEREAEADEQKPQKKHKHQTGK